MMEKHISPETLVRPVIRDIGKQWMLVGAVRPDGTYNAMTASWGGIGFLWGKPVAFVFVRPGRYTHEFTEASDRVTLSFLPEEYRAAMQLFGKKSGRDTDKFAEGGLHARVRDGYLTVEEAERILCGRKLYRDVIRPEGALPGANFPSVYAAKDYHTMYVYEITDVILRQD